MVSVVRAELSKLAATAAPQEKTSLAMIDSILQAVEVRSAYEIAWMLEEVDDTETLSERIIEGGADPGGAVADALAALRSGRHTKLNVADVAAEYDLASELLSRCLEASIGCDGVLRDRAEGLLRGRVEREMKILGSFSLAGRT